MNKYSPHQEDQCSDEIQDGARIIVECTSDGDLCFQCDWSKDDVGASCLGHILSILGKEGISTMIIEHLSNNPETNTSPEDIEKVVSFYQAIDKLYKERIDTQDDDDVISPLDAASLL